MSNIYSHWDIPSVVFYVIVGIVCAILIGIGKRKEETIGKRQKITYTPYLICIILLTIVATYRYIGSGVGGADAIAYKNFFETCLDEHVAYYHAHYDILYRFINYFIRYITSNYHVYSLLFYGFIATSFISFINEFLSPKDSKIPLILTFYLFLRGFNTYRTELAIAFLLISIILYKKDKKILAYIIAFSTFFLQKASILYAMALIFLRIFKNKKVNLKYCIIFIIIAMYIGRFFQPYLIGYFQDDTTNAYASYLGRSLNRSFFDSFWKICFEQFLLLFFIILMRKNIIKEIYNDKKYNHERNILWQLCIFDFITIPLTFIFGIWRGYEYLYIPRIIMLSLILGIFIRKCTKNTKFIVNMFASILIISWMVFRIYNTWEDSHLLPYIFEPIYSYFNQ